MLSKGDHLPDAIIVDDENNPACDHFYGVREGPNNAQYKFGAEDDNLTGLLKTVKKFSPSAESHIIGAQSCFYSPTEDGEFVFGKHG